ncbi:hypothetical protein PoB_003318600 [Plakobranchus ocellatus]|uniref:Uncharacterized protein n=1 Tax=Plakobranchus ocellatus TaxID=259542 RepID=A0AAV4AEF7_9GAST|nr:hypothetical protein PoB_003318600 [Plakobranchus ocellatus]
MTTWTMNSARRVKNELLTHNLSLTSPLMQCPQTPNPLAFPGPSLLPLALSLFQPWQTQDASYAWLALRFSTRWALTSPTSS